MFKYLLALALIVPQLAFSQAGQRVLSGDKVRNVWGPQNFIVNPDAEVNTRGVSNSGLGGGVARTTGTTFFGDAYFDISSSAINPAAIDWALNTVSSGLDNSNCQFSGYYTTSATGNYANIYVGATQVASLLLPLGTKKQFTINIPCAGVTKVQISTDIGIGVVISVDELYFGPATNIGIIQGQIATAFTPTVTVSTGAMTNATHSGTWSCVNNIATISVSTIFSGTPSAFTGVYYSMPPGLSIDTARLPSGINQPLGTSYYADIGAANYTGVVRYEAVTGLPQLQPSQINTHSGSVPLSAGGVTETFPFTFGNTDRIMASYQIPVTQCPGEQVVRLNNVASSTNMYGFTLESTCPQGWIPADGTNGTADFRGLTIAGAGTQTVGGISYSRTLATKQNDAMQGHRHLANGSTGAYAGGSATGFMFGSVPPTNPGYSAGIETPATDGTNGTPRTASETRMANIAVLFCKQIAPTVAPLVMQSVVSSVPYMKRIDSTKINCSSSSFIGENPGNWVTSVSNIASGGCTITWPAWPAAPQCTAIITNTGAAQQLSLATGSASTTGITIYGYGAGAALTNYNVDMICTGQR